LRSVAGEISLLPIEDVLEAVGLVRCLGRKGWCCHVCCLPWLGRFTDFALPMESRIVREADGCLHERLILSYVCHKFHGATRDRSACSSGHHDYQYSYRYDTLRSGLIRDTICL